MQGEQARNTNISIVDDIYEALEAKRATKKAREDEIVLVSEGEETVLEVNSRKIYSKKEEKPQKKKKSQRYYYSKSRLKARKKTNDNKLSKRTLMASFMILVMIPLTIYIGVTKFDDRKYYIISLFIILYTMVPFFMVFEQRRPQARELIIIAVLSAIGVAGRGAFFMLPQFKPVVAIVIISAVSFGAEAGFLVGAMTGFVSNFFFGQGPWTPWQMFSFGIIGFIAGILFKKGKLQKKTVSLCIYGGLSTFIIYGLLMDTATWIVFPYANTTLKGVLPIYISGIPFNMIHAIATIFFLAVISKPMIEKLDRIKEKYGLIEP